LRSANLTSIATLEAGVPKEPVISIVDDDASVRVGTLDLIKSMGFVAEAFQSADDFLKSSSLPSTSCLIADVRMPGLTGLELHDRLVRSGRNIPTILITAFPKSRDRARAVQAGVIRYLAKPFNDSELLSAIQLALERWKTDTRGS
jgi:FixJ family two-component response regulator